MKVLRKGKKSLRRNNERSHHQYANRLKMNSEWFFSFIRNKSVHRRKKERKTKQKFETQHKTANAYTHTLCIQRNLYPDLAES